MLMVFGDVGGYCCVYFEYLLLLECCLCCWIVFDGVYWSVFWWLVRNFSRCFSMVFGVFLGSMWLVLMVVFLICLV